MAWGAMGGIGAALTNLSANMAEMDKAKLRDKLEADREVARETREAAKLKRTTSYRKLTNGKWQAYNADDELLRETAATPEEIAKAKQEADMAALDLRNKQATTETSETELTWAREDRNLLSPEQRALSAKIKAGLELSAAEKEQARRWGLDYAQRDRHHSDDVKLRKAGLEGKISGASGSSPVDPVQDLRKQLGAQLGQMQTEYGLSVADMNNAIMGTYQEALKTSRSTGKSPSEWMNGTVFIDNLNRYLQARSK